MAIEKEVIVNKLKEEGVNEKLCNGLTFETEDELSSWVNDYKSGLPEPIKGLNEYTKEELEEVSKHPQFKGAKGFQGFMDSERVKIKESNKKPDPPKLKPDDSEKPPKWAEVLIQDTKVLKEQKQHKDFDELVTKIGKKEELDEIHIKRVKKGLKSDATEEEIKNEIKEYKKELNDLGIKNYGKPGGGSGHTTSSIKGIAIKYREKKLKKLKK